MTQAMDESTRPRYRNDQLVSSAVLAEKLAWRSKDDSGIAFLRRKDETSKEGARQVVLRLFGPQAFPRSLSILTFPSYSWAFERA